MNIKTGLTAAVVVVTSAGFAYGGLVIPEGFDMNLSYGSNTWSLSDNPEAIQDVIPNEDGGMTLVGAWMVPGEFQASWQIDLSGFGSDGVPTAPGSRGAGFAFISSSFNLTNMSAATQSFIVSVSQAEAPISPASMTGSNSGSTGDGGSLDGSIMSTTAGLPFYQALIDGAAVRTLFDDPFSVAAPVGLTNSYGPSSFSGEPTVPVTASVGINNFFDLTAGDNGQMTSTFLVIPTPGVGGLLMIAGFGFTRRRR